MRDLLYGIIFKRSKKWSRFGIEEAVKNLVDNLAEEAEILSIGGFGAVNRYMQELSKVSSKKFRLSTLDLDSSHEPDFHTDIAIAIKNYPNLFEKFDAIICIEVLEHVQDISLGLENIRDLLKPNGSFLGSTPWIIPIHDYPNDYWRFTQFGLRTLLSKFIELQIWSRGDYLASLLTLMFRGLRIKEYKYKWFSIIAYMLSFVIPKPRLVLQKNDGFTESPIGYIFSCKK